LYTIKRDVIVQEGSKVKAARKEKSQWVRGWFKMTNAQVLLNQALFSRTYTFVRYD
jgi:hypothetical protein